MQRDKPSGNGLFFYCKLPAWLLAILRLKGGMVGLWRGGIEKHIKIRIISGNQMGELVSRLEMAFPFTGRGKRLLQNLFSTGMKPPGNVFL